ncbi:hypothetical protein K3495_g7903 [Podosphaera aphanis]|nr:hypothetical protein K3495_g7903 [Podosphaera aphanis]
MSSQMQSKTFCKRSAPGAYPLQPTVVSSSSAPSGEVANVDFIKWSQSTKDPSSSEPVNYNLDTYSTAVSRQTGCDQPIPSQETQLARRPINQHISNRGQVLYNNYGLWGLFHDDTLQSPQNANYAMEQTESIEALEERAAIAKRDAQAKRKSIPPFVQKLSSFLEESRNTELIRWSEKGDSFIVLDEDEFAKTLIPELFKHNNYASFVRQLNMYGFHKRVGLSDNSMKASERKNKSPSEYYNPYFRRGHQNLLWLINKPRGNKNKKKIKELGTMQTESDDEKDIEEVCRNTVQTPTVYSTGPESNSLQRRDVNVLQNQLAEIQLQQTAITNALQRLRKDHNTLYQQSMSFQTRHDRHESSINAILNFLATIYNRSLDGQSPPNLTQLFSNGIPHNDEQNPVNVVDIGEVSSQKEQNPASMSPGRKAQRLLMAPPTTKRHARFTGSPISVSTVPSNITETQEDNNPQIEANNPQTEAIDEVFKVLGGNLTHRPSTPISSPSSSPPVTLSHPLSPNTASTIEQSSNIMSLINDTNAANSNLSVDPAEFSGILSHYEESNGSSSLTSEQRDNMISLIANSSTPGNNNMLISPSPLPSQTAEIKYASKELDDILRLHLEQDAKIREVEASLSPLSPLAQITNGEEIDYLNADLPNNNLDLDQFLDTGPYYTGSGNLPPVNISPYEYDGFSDDSNFCMEINPSIGVKAETMTEDHKADLSPENIELNESLLLSELNPSQGNSTTVSPNKRRRCG